MHVALGGPAVLVVSLVAAVAPAAPPNVVMIVSDDQAFADFGFMGHPTIRTPHIDRLASQSARFANGYVPMSLCRPSLATLLTGLYPHQHRICFNDPPDKANRQQAERLIAAVPTLPRLLAKAGYRSLQTGKFWEGHFSTAGFTEGMTHGDPRRSRKHSGLGELRGRHGDEGLRIGRDTMQPIFDFIDEQGNQPFFVWYAPMLPHEPHNPPERFLKLYTDARLHPKLARYYAMCTWFDATVGALLEFLDKKGLTDNTLVVFVVDNGWITNTTSQKGQPFAPRSKRSPYEMGLRTPILLRWPARIRTPKSHDDLVSSIDLVPTILAAADLPEDARKLPGLDLLPLAEGKSPALARKAVFGEIHRHDCSRLGDPSADLLYRWVRRGDWKLIDAVDPNAPDELYDLRRDPTERQNLFGQAAALEHERELLRILDSWWKP
jgi:uncharacterized sulfatase